MSINYKLNQLLNVFDRRRNSSVNKWAFIYGVPRSGTSFVFQKFLQQSKTGVSDWELSRIKDLSEYYAGQSHIGIDLRKFHSDILENIVISGQPGGSRQYDLVLKQIHTNKGELDFLINMIEKEPEFKLFIFREPKQWFVSAQKKFGLSKEELIVMYRESLDSYFEIGGHILEYKNIGTDSWLRQHVGEMSDFRPGDHEAACPNELEVAYKAFKEKLNLPE